jgi:hypothetical protein
MKWSLLLCTLTSFGHYRGIYTVRTGIVYLSFHLRNHNNIYIQ